MDRTELLHAARALSVDTTERVCDLLRQRPHLDRPVGGGSSWTVRDAAVHLVVVTNVYTEIAAGARSPYPGNDRATIARTNAALAADIAETDPARIARLVEGSLEEFLDRTRGWSGEQAVDFHGGLAIDLAALTVIRAAESLLHGYDIAAAFARPWPVTAPAARLVLDCYLPALPAVLDPAAVAGHTAGYLIDLRGTGCCTVRFGDGTCRVDPLGDAAETSLDADPVAFLLTLTGRMCRWTGFATGLLRAGGARPELAPGLFDLIAYP